MAGPFPSSIEATSRSGCSLLSLSPSCFCCRRGVLEESVVVLLDFIEEEEAGLAARVPPFFAFVAVLFFPLVADAAAAFFFLAASAFLALFCFSNLRFPRMIVMEPNSSPNKKTPTLDQIAGTSHFGDCHLVSQTMLNALPHVHGYVIPSLAKHGDSLQSAS